MDVLYFKSSDSHVQIKIATNDIRHPWHRFLGRVKRGTAFTYCDYKSTQEGWLNLVDFDNFAPELDEERAIQGVEWKNLPPVMYETCDYGISIRFCGIEGTPILVHKLKDVSEKFSYSKIDSHNGFLVGALNFVNEPGIFALSYRYKPIDKNWRTETLYLPIVSPKLDVKNDSVRIMQEINSEYNELVFLYLTKTFHNFSCKGRSENNIVWLSIFRSIIQGYIGSIEFIVNKPHMRTHTQVRYSHADRIKHWTPLMEERYSLSEKEHNLDETLFRHEIAENTSNTRENRFVKYTLESISTRLKHILKTILVQESKNITNEERDELNSYERKLKSFQYNRLFRTIHGENMREESIVMQKRTGYAQVYRYWLMLRRGIELYEGNNSIGTRPVWELYELWCFLKLRQMVAEILGINLKTDFDRYTENKDTMLNPFTDSKTEHRINYKNSLGEDIVELLYQHTFARSNKDNMHSATTINRPDFVLHIKKPDVQHPEKQMVLTYLFDAKYRVLDDEKMNKDDVDENILLGNAADYPQTDDINQMHRYRDAIYYGEKRGQYSSKEIIGGYILFAGRGDDESLRKRYYWKSIETVNIGAFPLLPNMEHPELEGTLLREHLQKILLNKSAYEHIKESIPQKGLFYTSRMESDENVYVGMVKESNPMYTDFKNRKAVQYYTGENDFPNSLDIQQIRFFLPLIKGKIHGLYKVISVNVARKSEKNLYNDNASDGVRIFLNLGEYIPLGDIEVVTHNLLHNAEIYSYNNIQKKYKAFLDLM